MPKTAAPLSPKEERFVAEYLVDGNGARAHAAAGYAGTPALHSRDAYKLLRRPRVRTAINAAKRRIQRKLELSAEKVLIDIDRIAKKAETAKDFGPALRGRELLGKHLKMFTDKIEHGAIGGGPLILHVTTTDEKL